MLLPKRVKHRKWQKGKRRFYGVEQRATELAFGSFGLKNLDIHWLTSRQIEAARRAIMRYFKKGGKLWIRTFPDKPITMKGNEVGMGAGKGAVDHYVFALKPGRIIFEIDGLKEDMALEALRKAAAKLPVKTKIIKRV